MRLITRLLLPLCASVSFSCLANTCDTGRLQSPINITSTQKQKLPALEFTYLTSPLVIANDGHTLRVRLNNHSQLKLGKQIYTLSQVHFHTPAGDQISGENFPMGAHFLHKSSSGQLLALVVLFRMGDSNKTFDTLLSNISKQVGPNQAIQSTSINVNGLLPVSKGYYRYMGSLTAPPCTASAMTANDPKQNFTSPTKNLPKQVLFEASELDSLQPHRISRHHSSSLNCLISLLSINTRHS